MKKKKKKKKKKRGKQCVCVCEGSQEQKGPRWEVYGKVSKYRCEHTDITAVVIVHLVHLILSHPFAKQNKLS